MKLDILHRTRYRYAQAATLIVQALRAWPVDCAEQQIKTWRVEVDGALLAPSCVDGFGNRVATHTVDGKVDAVLISVRGQIETRDCQGVHVDTNPLLPPAFYIAGTELTAASPEIHALAQTASGSGTTLDRMHLLSKGVRDRIEYRSEQTGVETTAAEALNLGAGVCQDHAQVMISAARTLGFAARYVSGYLCPAGEEAAASHAWAEVFVEGLGWVGFDPANRQCPDERYVRIACGRDYRDAAPVRGVRIGGLAETLEVQVQIAESGGAAQ